MKVVFLVSGGGGNFKFFHLAKKYKIIEDLDLFVIADRGCGAIEYAKKNQIPCKVIKYKSSDNAQLKKELSLIEPDFVITNWHKIIDAEIVSLYKNKLINLHYSLLPAFSGLIGIEPIKKAYQNNCQFVGATCHFVDEGVDTGKIISQGVVEANVPMVDAVQNVFEVGALILLNSILTISDGNTDKIATSLASNYLISPNLIFDVEVFSEQIFEELKTL